jgi:hypothetical protein
MLLFFAGCGSEPAPVAEQAPPPNADERRLTREFNALLRGPAIDVRFPVAECTTLPRRTRAELRDSPQRIAAARARLRGCACRTATTACERDWTRGCG